MTTISPSPVKDRPISKPSLFGKPSIFGPLSMYERIPHHLEFMMTHRPTVALGRRKFLPIQNPPYEPIPLTVSFA